MLLTVVLEGCVRPSVAPLAGTLFFFSFLFFHQVKTFTCWPSDRRYTLGEAGGGGGVRISYFRIGASRGKSVIVWLLILRRVSVG